MMFSYFFSISKFDNLSETEGVYLTLTKPDTTNAVSVVRRYMQNPKESNLEEVQGMLRYIKGTIDYGLYYMISDKFGLVGYYDTDYVSEHDSC